MIIPPPISQSIQSENNSINPVWINWFKSIFNKDAWPESNPPILNGVTGDYTTSGFWIRSGDLVNYTVTITVNSGTISYTTNDFLENLPFVAKEYGSQMLLSTADRQIKGTSLIVKGSRYAYLPSYSSSNGIVLIGNYIAKGTENNGVA
jgi:hypothetical protein